MASNFRGRECSLYVKLITVHVYLIGFVSYCLYKIPSFDINLLHTSPFIKHSQMILLIHVAETIYYIWRFKYRICLPNDRGNKLNVKHVKHVCQFSGSTFNHLHSCHIT